jgi:hypothetical protein
MDRWQHKGAFVIQFWRKTEVESGRFGGRIEHIQSSRATRFQSLDEILAFVTEVLANVRQSEAADSGVEVSGLKN